MGAKRKVGLPVKELEASYYVGVAKKVFAHVIRGEGDAS
jgi:hypothetical protein